MKKKMGCFTAGLIAVGLCGAAFADDAQLRNAAKASDVLQGYHVNEKTNTGNASAGAKYDISALPAAAQAQISATIGEDQVAYHAVRRHGEFSLGTKTNRLAAGFTPHGVEFRAGDNRWGLALSGYGYGDKMQPARRTAPRASANRVEYRRGTLTEWYLNGPLGLEQGFVLARAPGQSNGKPLTVALALSGTLHVSVDSDAHSLTLKNGETAVLRYTGLRAVDANGRELRAWLELAGNALRLRVSDVAARYPLTIDPMVQSVKLDNNKMYDCGQPGGDCELGNAGDQFGSGVAVSADGNTIVVGAGGALVNEVATGAAYVFLKPAAGWGGCTVAGCEAFTAKLVPSDGNSTQPEFGLAVAISGDGGTIVVGAPALVISGEPIGEAYVFVEPGSGWGSSSPLTETARLTPSGGAQNNLGTSVSVSNDGSVVAAGAPGYQGSTGAAYVYVRPASGWASTTETIRLTPSPLVDSFGQYLSLSSDGNTLAAGPWLGPPFFGEGYVFVFSPCTAGDWSCANQMAKLSDSSGSYLAVLGLSGDGNTIAVGTYSGTVDVFTKPANGWADSTQTATLSSSDAQLNFLSGGPLGSVLDLVSVSNDGSTIAAGAPEATVGSNAGQGAVYLFVRQAGGWTNSTEAQKLTASDGVANNKFGSSTAINASATVLVSGAINASVTLVTGGVVRSGATYVFTGLSGTPAASVSPGSLNFGNQAAGTTGSAQTVTVTNSGSGSLHISAVGATTPFTSTQNCVAASPIAPGGTCAENVAFAPSSAAPFTGALTFTDDSGGTGGTTQQAQLSGNGVKAGSVTAITAVSPNPVLVGQSVTVAFAVSPQSGDTLTPSGTVTVKANTGESCTGSSPSGSCAITFTALTLTSTTALRRTLTATYGGDSNFNGSTSSSFSETIDNFALSISPSSQTVHGGNTATYTVTVTPVNRFTGTVSLSCSGGPAGTSCTLASASVTVSGSAAGTLATVDVPTKAAKGAYTMTFTGSSGGATRMATAAMTVK